MSKEKTKKMTLPSGKVAEFGEFKFKHIQEAQRIAGENSENYMPALIALVVKIDGKDLLMEDVIEMDGFDGLALMGEFMSADTGK